MRRIEFHAQDPLEHIALDALALERAEAGEVDESVRLWMSERVFVALGRGARSALECDLARCRADAVPVVRRTSGGGTVLQGPGCLNFSLVLRYDRDRRFRDIHGSYGAVLGALARALRAFGLDVLFEPICDLTLDGRKFSGNAQARKRHFFLHHGTILFDFELDRIARYLPHPPREPHYRHGRPHGSFITNLPLARHELERVLLGLYPPDQSVYIPSASDLARIQSAIRNQFASDDWNLGR